MDIRFFWVDIENVSGARLGAGPLRAQGWRHIDRLSACGEFEFRVGAGDPNISALSEKRVAVCRYITSTGTVAEFGRGIIDNIERSVDESGALWLVARGNDIARELSYRSVGALDLAGIGAAGVDDAPEQIMAFAPAGWSISGGETETNVYAGFDGESVLAALSKVGEHIGEHWRTGSGRVITWLGPASGFAASGVRAVQQVNAPVEYELANGIAVLLAINEVSDAADLLTRVIPRGSGNGSAIVTLAAATASAPTGYTLNKPGNYVRRDDSETEYGRIERALDYKEIGPISNTDADVQAASNALLQAGVEHLRRYGVPQKFYDVKLHTKTILQPGTTLRVVARTLVDGVVQYDLDGVFNILEVTREIDAQGATTSAVTISSIDRLPQSDTEYLAGQMSQAQVLAAHQQLAASTNTVPYRDEMDNSHGASLRFWLGDEYTSVQRALLRFRIQPLRSTVKSVAGQSTTTASGGGSTSGAGGASTETSAGSAHGHHVTVYNGAGGNPVSFDGTFLLSAGPTDTFQTQAEFPPHDHSVSIPNHSHTTPNHTHTLTPVIQTVYGIFEESGANTLALADLAIKLNGGSDLSAGVVSLGGGWYALDITDELVNSVFRPAQESNEISITTAVAKTARIEAQLTIGGVVQAVNYS